nr:MAG TPA: hypothetical protein [Ackermannviridae sp.]
MEENKTSSNLCFYLSILYIVLQSADCIYNRFKPSDLFN